MSEDSYVIIPELNKISKILAGYLLLTNKEISYIFEYFTVLDTILLNKVTRYNLLQKFEACRCRPVEIILDIILSKGACGMEIDPHRQIHFNEFFQFICFICLLNLNCLFCFFILVSDCILKNTISVERFIGFYHLLEGHSNTDLCSIVSDLFGNNEEVTISQISKFICNKTTLFNTFLEYQKYLNDQIFSIFIHKRITDRFKRKADIIQWQLTHDKLPPLSCIEFLQCKLFCLVNPLQYDYPLQDDRTLYEVFVELSKNNSYQMRLITPIKLNNKDSSSSNSNNNKDGNNIAMCKSNKSIGYTKYMMKYTNPNYQAQPLSSTANSSSYESKMNLRISGNVNPMITKLKKVGSVHSLERVSGPLPSMFSSESNSEYRSNNYKHSSLSKVYLT